MSEISSHKQDQEQKKHGDPMEGALDEHDKQTPASEKKDNSIPLADNGSHAHSHAAHLGSHIREHTKPAGNLRRETPPSELREPPIVTSRVGKDHRKQ